MPDYTSGLAVAVAETVEQARELLTERYKQVWQITGSTIGNTAYWGFEKALSAEPQDILDLPAACFISGGA